MCLYGTLIKNPKYKANKKNGGIVPPITDGRIAYVPIGCQKCMECKKQKASEWKTRLTEDIKEHTNGKFVTFTFSEESMIKLDKDIHYKYEGYDRDNAIATRAIRLFLKRWYNNYKKPLRHWLITELGPNSTERIHIHGIIYTDIPKAEIVKVWEYGHMGWELTWEEEGNYCNAESVGYLVKYLHKADEKHPNYTSAILASAGIGNRYTESVRAKENAYNEGKTKEYYRHDGGQKGSLPTYYRNKIYSEDQREKLWIEKLDKGDRYVNGYKVNVNTKEGEKLYLKLLSQAQEENTNLGYGGKPNWEQVEYEKQLRNLKRQERNEKARSTPQQSSSRESSGSNKKNKRKETENKLIKEFNAIELGKQDSNDKNI